MITGQDVKAALKRSGLRLTFFLKTENLSVKVMNRVLYHNAAVPAEYEDRLTKFVQKHSVQNKLVYQVPKLWYQWDYEAIKNNSKHKEAIINVGVHDNRTVQREG